MHLLPSDARACADRSGPELLEAIRGDFYGLDTHYALIGGAAARRVYLDSAASCLPMNTAGQATAEFMRHYANTHSSTHFSARVSTSVYHWAHERVLAFLGADPDIYACIFIGSGATAAINRAASLLSGARPERDTALISVMEHHSNDLPHRRVHRRVISIPTSGDDDGALDLSALAALLEQEGSSVNYVAVTAASNVTGVCNPIADIAEMAHAKEALVVVDASQAIAHRKLDMGPSGNCAGADALVFSGHKLYAPSSPGVLICRKSLLDQGRPYEIGGGTVDRVYLDHYTLIDEYPDREEAGTPNIIGAAKLALTIEILDRIGMETIEADERRLLKFLEDGLTRIDGVRIYGVDGVSHDLRTPTLSFSMSGVDHGLLAAALNDYFGIAVRNQCFCAHPYVRELIKRDLWALPEELLNDRSMLNAKQGLVRISLGLYNDEADIDRLLDALNDIAARRDFYVSMYMPLPDGNYRHKEFEAEADRIFDPVDAIDKVLRDRSEHYERLSEKMEFPVHDADLKNQEMGVFA